MIDIKNMKWEELEALEKAIHVEKITRNERRFCELAKSASDALNALRIEFPWVELNFTVRCEECGEENEINLFDHISSFHANQFCMG